MAGKGTLTTPGAKGYGRTGDLKLKRAVTVTTSNPPRLAPKSFDAAIGYTAKSDRQSHSNARKKGKHSIGKEGPLPIVRETVGQEAELEQAAPPEDPSVVRLCCMSNTTSEHVSLFTPALAKPLSLVAVNPAGSSRAGQCNPEL